jgi:hypothetical protein
MIPEPKEVRKLSMGDELRAYEQSIMVGPAAIFLNREVEQKDVEAVITIYAAGMAARSRMLNAIYNTFIEAITSVEIGGYSDEEAQQWAKEEEDG